MPTLPSALLYLKFSGLRRARRSTRAGIAGRADLRVADSTPTQLTPHPARWSVELLPTISNWLAKHKASRTRVGEHCVLDPFAGVCRGLRVDGLICGELEWEWVSQCPRPRVQENALHLPFKSQSISAIVTSVTFGNRMADKHNARDSSVRNTYRHKLGRPLHAENSGGMQFGQKYKDFHRVCMEEWMRVLEPDGLGIVNIQDHIRGGMRVPVTKWWIRSLAETGFEDNGGLGFRAAHNRQGQNGEARTGWQYLLRFKKR